MANLEKAKLILLTSKLAQYGASTSVLENLTSPILKKASIRSIIRETTGKKPVSGLLPYTAQWYLASRQRKISSMLFYSEYYRTSRNEKNKAERLLQSYEIYFHLMNSLLSTIKSEPLEQDLQQNLLSVNHAWLMINLVGRGELVIRRCKLCAAGFIESDAGDSHLCPSCCWHESFICAGIHSDGSRCQVRLALDEVLPGKGARKKFCPECAQEKIKSERRKKYKREVMSSSWII